MTIDKMEVSAVTIPTVDMKNFKGTFSYASSMAKDVQVEMELSVCSTFSGCVSTVVPFCCVGVSGGITISTYTQTNCVGDVAMDGGSFCMSRAEHGFRSVQHDDSSGQECHDREDRRHGHLHEVHGGPAAEPAGDNARRLVPSPQPQGARWTSSVKETEMKRLRLDRCLDPACLA